MGIRPNRVAVARCRHEPVEVRVAITEELVGHLCALCLESVTLPPRPPSSRGGISALEAGENLQRALGGCTHGRGICERCDPWNAGRPEPRPVPGVSDRR